MLTIENILSILLSCLLCNYSATKAQNHKGTQMKFEPLSERQEYIATQIVEAAYNVHQKLGPGLLEKVYEVLSHLKLLEKRLGFLINFDVVFIRDGINRLIL